MRNVNKLKRLTKAFSEATKMSPPAIAFDNQLKEQVIEEENNTSSESGSNSAFAKEGLDADSDFFMSDNWDQHEKGLDFEKMLEEELQEASEHYRNKGNQIQIIKVKTHNEPDNFDKLKKRKEYLDKKAQKLRASVNSVGKNKED